MGVRGDANAKAHRNPRTQWPRGRRFAPARRILWRMLAATLVLAAPGDLMGQDGGASAASAEPRPEDVATIDGIIRAYYEVVSGPAGEAADAARDRTLHHPDAWVAIAGTVEGGRPRVRVMSLDDYHGERAPRAQGFWEWETDREVRRSGNMAHVWSHYASARTPDGEPLARGVNSITLFHDGDRWWIMGWMFDTSAEAEGQ